MKLDYNMDLNEESYSKSHTTSSIGKRLPLYIEGYGHFFAGEKYYTQRDELNNYLIIYTKSGQGLLKYRNKEYLMQRNQIVLINCMEYQYYRAFSAEPWEFKWIHFNGLASKEYFDLINDNQLNIIKSNDSVEIDECFNKIYELSGTNDVITDTKICMILVNLITILVSKKLQPENDDKFQKYKTDIDKVKEFIQNNYSGKININDFIELVHLSRYHFLRIFKKYTGSSPYEYLTNYRMSKSKVLLKESEMNVNEIAFMVGYTSTNIFIRDFKKYVGNTPLKYRMSDLD